MNTKDQAVDNGSNNRTVGLTCSVNDIDDGCAKAGNNIRDKSSTTSISEEGDNGSIFKRFRVGVVECGSQWFTVWARIKEKSVREVKLVMVKDRVLGKDGLGLTRGDLLDRVVCGINIATTMNNNIVIIIVVVFDEV